MKHLFVSCLGAATSLIALLLVVSIALAASGYDLTWWTVDNGGGQSVGGTYTLSGTLGQAEAGQPMTGGNFSLAGGFWQTGITSPALNQIYLPLIIKGGA
jgi:hypothetical protein